jgi:hypothetical protein
MNDVMDTNKHEVAPLTMRDSIFGLEVELLKEDQQECPLAHFFAPGVYVRQCFNPKGVLIVGKIQKYQHICMLTMGEVSVLTENGTIRCKSPFTWVARAGSKRVVFAHEDSVFVTIHHNPNDETDQDKLEEMLIATDYGDIKLDEVGL